VVADALTSSDGVAQEESPSSTGQGAS